MVEANNDIGPLLEALKSADNNVRTQAEAQLKGMRETNARGLYQAFMAKI